MSSSKSHFVLFLDVFEYENQRAEVLNNLTPPELIAAAIEEFQDLEFLNQPVSELCLQRVDTGEALDVALPIRQQVEPLSRLRLAEVENSLPVDTIRPSAEIYLLESGTSQTKAYKLHWFPAIVGRSDNTKEHDDWVAVDFSGHAAGTRVSRRHIQVDQDEDELRVYLLSNNPVTLQRQGEADKELQFKMQYSIRHGDVLTLDRSRISLRVFIREGNSADDLSDDAESPQQEENAS